MEEKVEEEKEANDAFLLTVDCAARAAMAFQSECIYIQYVLLYIIYLCLYNFVSV